MSGAVAWLADLGELDRRGRVDLGSPWSWTLLLEEVRRRQALARAWEDAAGDPCPGCGVEVLQLHPDPLAPDPERMVVLPGLPAPQPDGVCRTCARQRRKLLDRERERLQALADSPALTRGARRAITRLVGQMA